jgi:chemotaxis protein CheX
MLSTIELSDILETSAREMFETMIFMDISNVSDSDSKVEGEALLGSITFTNGSKGCMTICCNMDCAKTIALNMLGMEPDSPISEDEICDAVGEVTNIVMGSVKKRIRETFGEVQVSIPTVIRGREIRNSLGEPATKVQVKLNIDDKYLTEITLLYKEIANQ